ncbi:MAG TPA: hypothetical protein VK001_02225 [Geminicoccaceae bacterium]|nr:hypothetical protein [Geminicoccaceae bacterium]
MHEYKSRIPALVPASLLAILLAGCAAGQPFGSTSPELDRQFGESVRQLRAAQTLDPQAAERNLGKTTTLDGQAASQAAGRYQDSFKEPPPTFTILGSPVQSVRDGQ